MTDYLKDTYDVYCDWDKQETREDSVVLWEALKEFMEANDAIQLFKQKIAEITDIPEHHKAENERDLQALREKRQMAKDKANPYLTYKM